MPSNYIYITIRDADGKVWNGSAFETWSDGSIANYVVNASYAGGLLYTANFPEAIINGYYTIQIFLQAGGSPVVANDIWIGNAAGYWDKDNLNLIGVRVDTLVEYSSGQRFSEKAVEAAGTGGLAVNIDHDTEKIVIDRSSDPTFTEEE